MSYFDFQFDKFYGEGEIVIVKKNTYFRNVIFFIKRLRDVIFIKGFFMIKINLNITLKNTILLYYIIKLLNFEKVSL